ncbi:MAG TPA: ATP-binding protein [bacterium (Candidatus Stahlbacteria)]|nr:ATP-binding protein [Candidatus Stahlbacteria bacterium]
MIAKDKILSRSLLPRRILPWLRRDLTRKEAILLTGSRRAGKTSVLFLLAQELIYKGRNTILFDLEDPDDLDVITQGPEVLKRFMKQGVCFIDEFHYLPDPARFVKLCVDHYPEIKLICTGSSTLKFYKKARNSIIGRIIEYELYPLDFREFLKFKRKERYLNLIPEPSLDRITGFKQAKIPDRLLRLYEEFLIYGGYPESVLAPEYEKIRFLSRLFKIYAKRDLREFYTLRNEFAFENFFYMLGDRVGSLINLHEISKEIGVSLKTVKNYLFLLENLFMVKVLHPIRSKVVNSIRKMPKVYFVDTGLLCWTLRGFDSIKRSSGMGRLVENRIFIDLLQRIRPMESLYFARKKSGVEIDFVVKGKKNIGVEVKWSHHPEIPKRVLNYLRELDIERLLLLSINTTQKQIYRKRTVVTLPALMI